MWKFFKKWFFLLVLMSLCLVLIWQNYNPKTFLTGWDTLHPEFNFPENFKRLFFGVWRAEQGLGAVAGHSHMADLPRVFLLWIWSFFLPVAMLRYAYLFFCLFLGPLGVYWLLQYLFKKNRFLNLTAFLGALVYLLNLSTLQQFFVAFEMFVTQWAYLPWLILFSVKFLKEKTKSSLLLYAIFTLLATPQAYAAHLWYPFFGFYCLFLLFRVLVDKKVFKQVAYLFIITVLINSFWLLPNLFFIFNSGNVARENLHNQLYSQEFLAKNRATGTLAEVALIKGFYFNWQVYNFNKQTTTNLMQVWNEHLKNTDVLFIGYSLFALSLLGLSLSFTKKRRKLLVFIPFFIFSFILLANRTWPFNLFFDLLLRLPLFEEALRFSFTKLSILALFGMVIYISVAINWLLTKLNNKSRIFFSLALFISLIIYVFPSFRGNMISKAIRQKIPQEYFDFWQYLQKQPDGRVLTLPLNNSSGWVYYDWQYQGSGLIWFGMPQMVMDRDFDRWSHYNEQAYREFFNALYTQNYPFFESALRKYRISYILRDLNQIPPGGKNEDQITLRRETNTFFRQLQLAGKVKHVSQFGKNLLLYELNNNYGLVEVGSINKQIEPSYKWQIFDWQYENADYITTQTESINYFPFRNIFQKQHKIKADFVLANINLSASKNTRIISAREMKNANPNETDLVFKNNKLTFQSQGGVKGLAIDTLALQPAQSYLIAVKSQYFSGFPLRLCFYNYYTQTCQINDQLSKNQSWAWDYFLVAGNLQNSQYQLQLNALAYSGISTKTQVEQIIIKPISLNNLAFFTNNSQNYAPGYLKPVDNLQTSCGKQHYRFVINSEDKTILLSQAFDPGWHAYLNGRELKNHVLVNNWANGWVVPEGECGSGECQVKIIFWPQYLQFIGFGLLLTSLPLISFHFGDGTEHKNRPVDK